VTNPRWKIIVLLLKRAFNVVWAERNERRNYTRMSAFRGLNIKRHEPH